MMRPSPTRGTLDDQPLESSFGTTMGMRPRFMAAKVSGPKAATTGRETTNSPGVSRATTLSRPGGPETSPPWANREPGSPSSQSANRATERLSPLKPASDTTRPVHLAGQRPRGAPRGGTRPARREEARRRRLRGRGDAVERLLPGCARDRPAQPSPVGPRGYGGRWQVSALRSTST